MTNSDQGRPTRYCPACAEEILAAAQKCKHCGEWIEEAAAPSPSEKRAAPKNTRNRVVGVAIAAVGLGVIGVGTRQYCAERAHHKRLEAIDLSSLDHAAESVCIALRDGQQDIQDAVFDREFYKEGVGLCNSMGLWKECGSPMDARDCKPKGSYPECTEEKVREEFRELVKRLKNAGAPCKVVSTGAESARIATHDGIVEEVRFTRTPEGWRPRPGLAGFLPRANLAILEEKLRKELGDEDYEALKALMDPR